MKNPLFTALSCLVLLSASSLAHATLWRSHTHHHPEAPRVLYHPDWTVPAPRDIRHHFPPTPTHYHVYQPTLQSVTHLHHAERHPMKPMRNPQHQRMNAPSQERINLPRIYRSPHFGM